MSSEAVGDVQPAATKFWWMPITMFGLIADQVTKYWSALQLRDGTEIDVIPGLVKFSYTENPGIAFGMLNSGNVKWLLVGVSVVAIGFVLYYLSRTAATNRLLIWSLALLAAGISGNLVDRIRLGKVIDFILIYYQDYKWPVFNIADTAITIGAALMAIELFVGSRAEGEPAVAAAAAASAPSEAPIKEASTDEA
jgi:signal peptidase II